MTEYRKLLIAERIAHTVEIVERSTGKRGIAAGCPNGAAVFNSNDDGNDDKGVNPRTFNRDFQITAAILE